MAGPTLLDAVLAANEARARGETSARADLARGAFPFLVTCMDPRLAGVLIPALGLEESPPPQAKFAGGVIRPGDASGVRSVLAAAIFNMATEVLLVGHTDCRMGKTSAMEVRGGISRLGIPPGAFGAEDPVAWLGAFTSEIQAVRSSVEALRSDPRMPASIPIHGLLYNLESKRLAVVVRGYGAVPAAPAPGTATAPGPVAFGFPPPPSLGVPGQAGAASFGAPGPVVAGPVSFGAPGPAAPGPVSFATLGAPPPLVPPGGAGPPPSFPAPPPMAVPQKAAPAEVELDTPSPPLPPPVRPSTREEHEGRPPKAPKRKGKGDSPFDRAMETLERMRRDRER